MKRIIYYTQKAFLFFWLHSSHKKVKKDNKLIYNVLFVLLTVVYWGAVVCFGVPVLALLLGFYIGFVFLRFLFRALYVPPFYFVLFGHGCFSLITGLCKDAAHGHKRR